MLDQQVGYGLGLIHNQKRRKKVGSYLHYVPIWLLMKRQRLVSAFSSLFILLLFFYRCAFCGFLVGSMHGLWDTQTSFFNKSFIKNRSHNTIYTFKNYFITILSVFNKISGIQTHLIYFTKWGWELRTMKRKSGKWEGMEERKIFIPHVVWLVGKNTRKWFMLWINF